MSEISDAVQIIRVAYDGVEIAMKVGSGSIKMMQKAIDLIVGMLKYEKTMGKTNLKGMLQKGGDIQVLSFADEDLRKFKKMANKYGILYSIMPDAGRKDGITEVMFHSEAAPRVRIICQKLTDGRMFNIDEYLKNGNEEQLNQLLKHLEKEKMGNRGLRTEEARAFDTAIDGLIQKIGTYINEKGIRDVIADKSEFMLGLCDQLLGNTLNQRHHSIIDRCIRDLYMQAWRVKKVPLMSDFYYILKNQKETEAQELALSLELFVEGSLNLNYSRQYKRA